MTRLFLRFYIGVVGILVLAGLIQSWLTGERFAAQNAQVVRDALFGGVRNARDKYRFGLDRGIEDALLKNIQDQFDYPVTLVSVDPGQAFDVRLADGREEGYGDGVFILARVAPTSPRTLLFGPLPVLPRPSLSELLTGVSAVFAIAALLIALLLRPVVEQFQRVEKAATQIAGGDLTARIRHEGTHFRNLGQAFNDMASRTETLVSSQRELLQAVSHELRTPLSRIHFAIDLIREGDEATREQRLNSLSTAAEDLDQLVEELLSYVRLEGVASQILGDVSLGRIAARVVQKLQPQHPDIQIDIGKTLAHGELRGAVDPAAFERVISNLVSNALRYASSTVSLNAEQTADNIALTVDDDGPGISVEDREKVLEPFVKADGNTSGVGLGLSIVRRILQQHEGSVMISASPRDGCRVTTVWPRHVVPSA